MILDGDVVDLVDLLLPLRVVSQAAQGSWVVDAVDLLPHPLLDTWVGVALLPLLLSEMIVHSSQQP